MKKENKRQKKNIIKLKEKRSFILLEILIAITLLSLLLIPLIKNPMTFLNKEIKALKEIESLNIKKRAFLDIKKRLYKNMIPTQNFSLTNKQKVPIRSIPTKPLTIKDLCNIKKHAYYKIWTKGTIKNGENLFYKKLAIQISLDPKSFKKDKNKLLDNELVTFYVFVQIAKKAPF